MRIEDWRDASAQPLPLAPVASVDAVVMTARDGAETALPPEAWRLVPDNQRPLLRPGAGAGLLPVVPEGGFVTLTFTAGFGAGWDAIPPDLAQAVILLAAQYYEDRGAAGLGAALPFPVAALIERWRAVRMLGARGAAAGSRGR